MRNPVALLLLLSIILSSQLTAQPLAPNARPDVPAAFDVAGIHLVLNAEAQRLVQQKADGLRRHQPSFQARVDVADAAFPIIDRVLKEEGVPLDFRYLPLQESALLGDARSVHDAVGYWQLKQETATSLGLTVNADVDERQHLAASTRAAARYLTRNNAPLHNWLNALLSYNTGPTGVKPFTLPSDFDATEMAITEATSPYVLMFLAHKLAFEPACGLNPTPALRLQEFPAVAGQNIGSQALALHAEPGVLALHNRWLLAAAVPADRSYTLVVPVGDVTQAAGIVANQRLQSSKELLAMPAVGANAAEVRLNNLRALIALPGETTADLARRGHRRQGEFLRDNELTAFDAAVTGRPYYLESKRDVAAVEYHVLRPGENIFDVAQKYGIRQKAIFNKNRLSRRDELRPGRVLWLQHTRPREVAVEYRTLAEGAALERPTAAANDVLVDRLNETSPVGGNVPSETVKIKIKVKNGSSKTKQVLKEDGQDGWGEVLSTATVAAAQSPVPAAAPAPVRPAAPLPKPAALPPPASAPAPAPLADEPAPAVVVAPATARPAAVYAPAPRPAPAPKPLPESPAVAAARPMATPAMHRIEPGQTLSAVGRLYGIPVGTLMALNGLAPPANLAVGQVLLLQGPAARPMSEVAPALAAPRVAPRPAAGVAVNTAVYVPMKAAPAAGTAPEGSAATQHTVAKGETLYSISKLYRVTVADLQAWNAKAEPSVKVGEVLRVQADK